MSANNTLLYILLAIITGALIPMQASMNAAFSKTVGSAGFTGLFIFILGLAVMSAYVLLTRTPIPSLATIRSAPGFSYLGGLVVAIYVVMITILTPRLGVGAAIGLILCGQLLSAVCIDHFGLFHTAVRSITWARVMGMLLMMGGIYLVMRKGGS